MFNVAGGLWLFFLTAIIFISIIGKLHSDEEIRKVCLEHNGVQQVESAFWDISAKHVPIIVCKDGWVDSID